MTLAEQLIVAIVPGLVIAVVTSIITVSLSLRSFSSEKWWERKAEAYSSIVEALYDVKQNLTYFLSLEEHSRVPDEDIRTKLTQKAVDGYERIYRAAGIGAFIISDDASHELASLKHDLEPRYQQDTESFYEWLDKRAARVSSTLNRVRSIAKTDLNVK